MRQNTKYCQILTEGAVYRYTFSVNQNGYQMKPSAVLLFSIVSLPAFAGDLGGVQISPDNTTYALIGGGYYSSNYLANYTNYFLGALTAKKTFNDTNNSGYGQIGLGATARVGSLEFDHQLVIAKLGASADFISQISSLGKWSWSQDFDFGYDWMPKINLVKKFTAYGILGVHYARFDYVKIPLNPTSTMFDHKKNQIGFNLGAGLFYALCPSLDVGVKYQHWQYNSIQFSGLNPSMTMIDVENITPTFNLVGAEVRYTFVG